MKPIRPAAPRAICGATGELTCRNINQSFMGIKDMLQDIARSVWALGDGGQTHWNPHKNVDQTEAC